MVSPSPPLPVQPEIFHMPKDCSTRTWLFRILRLFSCLCPLVPPVHFHVIIISSVMTAVDRGIAMARAENLPGSAHASLAITGPRAVAAAAALSSRSWCLCAGLLTGRRRVRCARLLSSALGLLDLFELLPVAWGKLVSWMSCLNKGGEMNASDLEGRGRKCVCLYMCMCI